MRPSFCSVTGVLSGRGLGGSRPMLRASGFACIALKPLGEGVEPVLVLFRIGSGEFAGLCCGAVSTSCWSGSGKLLRLKCEAVLVLRRGCFVKRFSRNVEPVLARWAWLYR